MTLIQNNLGEFVEPEPPMRHLKLKKEKAPEEKLRDMEAVARKIQERNAWLEKRWQSVVHENAELYEKIQRLEMELERTRR